MYDQVGFYSDNGFAAGGRSRRSDAKSHPNMDFGGFDFSEMFKGAQAETESRRRHRGAGGGGRIQGHLQPVFPFRRRLAEDEPEARERARISNTV